jgi:hypothetical protein
MTHQQVRAGVTVSALCFAIFGAMLLFAPKEVGGALVPESRSGVIAQLLGAALLGFGAMNWIARGSAFGGIYGRAVVAGNQTHLVIGAFVLVKRGIDAGADHTAYWVLTGLYVLGASFFVYLTFFSSGLREHRSGSNPVSNRQHR